jgi:hypothetical protein
MAASEPAGYRLAKEIQIDRDDRGAPRITIDGEVFPYGTAGIVTPAPSLNDAPTVTITLLAEKVTMVNDFPKRLGSRK